MQLVAWIVCQNCLPIIQATSLFLPILAGLPAMIRLSHSRERGSTPRRGINSLLPLTPVWLSSVAVARCGPAYYFFYSPYRPMTICLTILLKPRRPRRHRPPPRCYPNSRLAAPPPAVRLSHSAPAERSSAVRRAPRPYSVPDLNMFCCLEVCLWHAPGSGTAGTLDRPAGSASPSADRRGASKFRVL